MKTGILLAALALAGCAATGPATYPVERSATVIRGSHATICGAVLSLHAAGKFTGKNFNAARQDCIDADDLLDAGDLIAAQAKIGEAHALTPNVSR